MEKVTIIIPVYNSEKYIERCLDSIRNESYKNIEVIALNDGSKDKSLKLLKDYKKKYKDFNLKIIDKENEGIAKTRNRGIEEATGDYIMFMDNDDYIDKDYVKHFMNAKDKETDIVIGGYKRVSDDKILREDTLHTNSPWSKYLIITPWSKLYRRKFLKDNNIKFLSYGIGEDVYFNLFAYQKTYNIKIIEYSEYNWYYNDKSVSNTKHKGLNKDIDITYLLDNLNSKSKEKDIYYKYFIYRFCIWYLLYSGRYSNKEAFINEYERLKKYLISIDCYKVLSPFSSKLKGETFKNRFIVFAFKIISKLKLIKLFAKFYCRGE